MFDQRRLPEYPGGMWSKDPSLPIAIIDPSHTSSNTLCVSTEFAIREILGFEGFLEPRALGAFSEKDNRVDCLRKIVIHSAMGFGIQLLLSLRIGTSLYFGGKATERIGECDFTALHCNLQLRDSVYQPRVQRKPCLPHEGFSAYDLVLPRSLTNEEILGLGADLVGTEALPLVVHRAAVAPLRLR